MTSAISDVLRDLRLSGGVFVASRLTSPFCLAVALSRDDCAPFLDPPARLVCYHVVLEGRLLVTMPDEAPVEIGAGEVALFPHGHPHELASEPGLAAMPARELVRMSPEGGLARIDHGGGGEETRIVCGFLACEEKCEPLFSTLPPMLRIDLGDDSAREWTQASVKFAASELAAGKLANSGAISRLCEILLGEAIGKHLAALPAEQAGWLRGLGDPQVGRALSLIHRRPDARWSTEALAREVAASRSAFVDRFTSLVGVPPIRYLTMRRMQNAKTDLRSTRKTVAQVAWSAGYESEEAFSRAFKREYGVSPARWRDRAQAA